MGGLRGSCLCGAVVFEVAGGVSEIELCHCPKCRKAYGAAFAATVYAGAGGFRWLAGEDEIRVHDAPLASRPPAYRHSFCATCGSPLPLLFEGLPFVEIPVALFDGEIAARPAYQQFVGVKAPWHTLLRDLPRHDRGAPPAEKVTARWLRESGAVPLDSRRSGPGPV